MKFHSMKLRINHPQFFLGCSILFLPYIFWLWLGNDSYVLIHDNLDGEFVYIKQLIESGHLFGFDLHGRIYQVMNGIDRSFYRSGMNITFLIFSFFSSVNAYITHHLIVHLIGYFGMYLLLKKYFIKNNDSLVMLISIIFGCLNYYHIQYGISISGQPLLLFAFLNILNDNKQYYNWIIITLFPFFSFLPVTLPFFIPLLILIGLFKYYETKKVPVNFLIAIVGLLMLNLFSEFNLVYSTIFGQTVSHRTEWNTSAFNPSLNFNEFISSILGNLKKTQYHSGVLSPIPIIISLLLGFVYKIKISRVNKLLFATILLISVWVAFNSTILLMLAGKYPILKVFNSARFYFLLPLLWLLILATILNEYNWHIPIQRYSAIALIIITGLSTLFNNIELKKNLVIFLGHPIDEPTFAQFYDVDLFRQVKANIGNNNIEKYNFITVGFYPNIAQYNGLHTLDSYQNNYSLDYKHEFRKIIKGELDKSNELTDYFDNWGSRCYAFSAELGTNYLFNKNSQIHISQLDFNLVQFRRMNGKYILSSVPIENNKNIGLAFRRSFTTEKSFWKLYLYETD